MNDLTSLRELGQAIDTGLRGPAPELRQRVLAECGGPPGGRARPGRRPRFAPGWRLAVTGGLAVALAAALLAVSTLRLLGAPPGATAQAATILDRAAAAAARQPALRPRPSQYIFISGLGTGAVFDGATNQITRMTADLHQVWLSVSGTRKGLVRDQPRSPANLHKITGPWQSMTLPPEQAAYPVLPTSAGAMLSYLYRTRQGQNPPPVEAFIHAGDLISQSYLRPAELVALFGALRRLPGVSVVRHAVTISGQRGIAVQQVFHGISDQLIFNRRSYAFIGNREVSVSRASGMPVGGVLSSNAVLRIAVVDRPGQLP
jgi:hypothetical protein